MGVTTAKKIKPEDYILSVLSPEERLDAAFKVAKEAFKRHEADDEGHRQCDKKGEEKGLRKKEIR